MKDGKYNEQVYMPKLSFRDIDVQLRYTYHAIIASLISVYASAARGYGFMGIVWGSAVAQSAEGFIT